MLPEVQEFYDTLEGSNEYYTAQRAVENAYPVARWDTRWGAEKRAEWYKTDTARSQALVEFRHEARERHCLAEDALKKHKDPVIKWLMTSRYLGDYSGYRDEVLKALPMTREEMETYGDKRGWCSDYARMLERAEKDGVLPPAAPELADIDALVEDLARNLGNPARRYQTLIRKHLPAIIASYEEKKAAQEKADEPVSTKPKRVARKKVARPAAVPAPAATLETGDMPALTFGV